MIQFLEDIWESRKLKIGFNTLFTGLEYKAIVLVFVNHAICAKRQLSKDMLLL